MCRPHFIVIGMTDEREVWFPPQVSAAIAAGRVFSGGRRHYEIVAPLLPEGAVWIDITVPLDAVFEQYKGHPEIVVFASGDPLFFGFANTLRRELPDADITVFPAFNSLQMLAHRMQLPYADMRTVSLTGRPWDGFDEAVIRGDRLIGALTDRHKTPAL
ncbi:MAG: precorrin-6y C5,15-methyltransferase (decarboxylating) subunit CbiE, partial [Bacteroidales bacterium]|nr:precorrin-6y C5,15-methyltransferase (decarboxylating) subunit CbiE [Bacteroidales bacterium]